MKGVRRLKYGLLALLGLLGLGLCPWAAFGQTASLLPNGEQTFVDANGAPLAGGSVYFYVPNTLTPKTTWSDPGESTPNANPVVLDAAGRGIIYGSGTYRQIVKDAAGNTQWDQLTQDPISAAQSGLGTAAFKNIGTSGDAVPDLNNTFSNLGGAWNEASVTVASAGTMAIGAAQGNYILVTGTTGITAFDSIQAGTERTLKFAASVQLTASGSLILPNSANIVTMAGDTLTFRSEGSGNWRLTGASRASGTSVTPKGWIAGLTLSNDGGTPNTILDIAAGQATDATGVATISIGAFTKLIGGSWVAGTAQNGMGNGLTVASSTWYHVCLSIVASSGLGDVFFDTSASCANKPTGIAISRRIGSFKTDVSTHILGFVQSGDLFYWTSPPLDVNGATTSTSSRTAYSLSTPPGVVTEAIVNYSWGGNGFVYFTNLGQTDTAASSTAAPLSQAFDNGVFQATGQVRVLSDLSSQIYARATTASASFYMAAQGWRDFIVR